MFLRYLKFQKLTAVFAESLLLIAAVLVNQLRLGVPVVDGADYIPYFSRACVVAFAYQLFLHLMDVYDFRLKVPLMDFARRLSRGLLLGGVFVFVLRVVIPDLTAGFGSFGSILIRINAVVILWHILVRFYFNHYGASTKVLIVGTGPLARALATEIVRRPELGLFVVGFVDDKDDKEDLLGVSIVNPRVIGMTRDLAKVVAEKPVARIAVELQDRRGHMPTNELLALKTRGVKIEEATSLYEQLTGKIALQNLKASWLIFNDGFNVRRKLLAEKQILGFAVSLVLAILLFPLIPFIALLIKLDSRGPVFFKQERVGQNGKLFILYKFRSMRTNAEKETGPTWAVSGDCRVTRIGKLLRRSRLDEIPQLFNVLKGDMRFVGPRPERQHFVQQLLEVIPFYDLRHSVKPGLTGWAQVNYGYGSTVEDAIEKLQYDLFYIKNMSLLMDGIVMFDTIKTVLLRKGS